MRRIESQEGEENEGCESYLLLALIYRKSGVEILMSSFDFTLHTVKLSKIHSEPDLSPHGTARKHQITIKHAPSLSEVF